ncbi:MAG: hypothetical protein EU543_04280 [Promethearchaeota archaeon]|nr:MAG: hypothetical protein EU543_04280 [Candidatus Lokiarchaeota archaeon]
MISCPKCGEKNKIIYYASINTFMDIDGNLIARLIDGTLNTHKCHNCGTLIRLSRDILINTPDTMFYLNPTYSREYKESILKKNGILTQNGKNLSGPGSALLKAKAKLEKEQVKPSPLPPPAPKITPHTQTYNEIYRILSEKMSPKIKKDSKNDNSKNDP